MTSLKVNGRSSTFGLQLANARRGEQLPQIALKPKRNLRKLSTFLLPLQARDEPESSSWKIYAYSDTVNGVARNSLTKFLPKSEVSSGDSGCKSEGNRSFDNKGYSEDLPTPANHPVNLLDKLKAVRLHLLASEHWNASQLKLCDRLYLASATNLTHYIALHCLDIKQFKENLSSIGLLNLDSINSHILASINVGIELLENLLSHTHKSKDNICDDDGIDYIKVQESKNWGEYTMRTMKTRASFHSVKLFGPCQGKKNAHIMVTIGQEVISNEMLLRDILKAGANVVRINCAHGDPSVWGEIIRIAKKSSQMLEKPCRILMDLAGPKLRTGLLMKDEVIMRISPKKDVERDILLPAQVWLCRTGSSPPSHLSPDAILCVDQEFFNNLKVGDVLSFVDFRGRKRSLKLDKNSPLVPGSGFMIECSRTAYIGLGTKLYMKKTDGKPSVGQVVSMPAVEQFMILKVGDMLTISRDSCFMDNSGGAASDLTRITCSSDHLFVSVKPGEPIAFDDGRIWGKVQEKNINEIKILITHASPEGSRLGPRKSINIPESEMQLKGLTPKDLVDLDFVATHADMVGISFLRDADDVVTVQHELEKRRLQKLGIILKIETRDAFEKLPQLLFQAMQLSNPLGVMIARGDLMVECGWEQMAGIQEEIMSICNAAHIPVIWATQVLESLVKFGLPTRAEITDAATGRRASCVMLNKGEHIVEAVSGLASILCSHSTENKSTVPQPLFPSSHLSQ